MSLLVRRLISDRYGSGLRFGRFLPGRKHYCRRCIRGRTCQQWRTVIETIEQCLVVIIAAAFRAAFHPLGYCGELFLSHFKAASRSAKCLTRTPFVAATASNTSL